MDFDRLLPSVLEPGESIIWSGGPDPKIVFAPQDAFTVPFSVLFLGCASFMMVGSIFGGAPAVFVGLCGLLFAWAAYNAFGRFVYKRWDRRRTAYLITDRRALVVRRMGSDVRSVSIAMRPDLVEVRTNGTHGTMRWGAPGPAESPQEWLSPGRIYGRWAGTYWFASADSADLSFWDVAEFNNLKRAQVQAFSGARAAR